MKRWKKLLTVALIVIATFGIVQLPVGIAEADIGVDATLMLLDDTFASGTIGEIGAANFYEVNLPTDGWLTVTYQGWDIYDSYYSILNGDMTHEYTKKEVYNSSDISPKTSSQILALETGKYIIKVWGCGNHTGNYKLKASFESAENNEDSDNNQFTTAQLLQQEELVTGFLSEDDTVDFYKIEVPSDKTIQIIYTARIADSYFQVWNEDNTERHKKEVYRASETQPSTYLYEAALNPGIYYIQIYPCGSHTGRYTLQWKEKVMTESLSVSSNKSGSVMMGEEVELSANFTPSNITVATVTWQTSDYNTAEVDENGKVTTKRPGIVKITATATDGSNKFDTYTLIIKPKKTQNLRLSAGYSGSRRLGVAFNTQYGSTGYQVQYATNRSFRKGIKNKKITSSSIVLENLKKKRYYVRVRAYVKNGKKIYNGPWSVIKSIRVK